MFTKIKMLLRDEEAPTAVEYGLMVAGIAVLIIGAVWALGGGLSNLFGSVNTQISNP